MSELGADDDEVLETGHEHTTPDGDNLLLDFLRGEAAAYRAIVEANGGRVLDDDELGLHLADLAVATPFGNTAHLTRPVTEETRAQVVGLLGEFFGAATGGPYLVFSAWPTPDLRADGFTPVGHPPLMLRPAGPCPDPPSGLRIERAADAATLADFEQTLIEAYPIPEMQPWQRGSFLDPAIMASPWQLFVGYQDGEPVATAGAFVTEAMVMVELVSARPETRGKGYGAAVTAAATTAAPHRPALLIASDLGRGVYDRLGYVPLLRQTLWLGGR